MDRRVQIFGADRRQHDQRGRRDSSVSDRRRRVGPAVDGDREAARDQAGGELLHERLVAAVAAGDAAAAEQSDVQGPGAQSGSPPARRTSGRWRRRARVRRAWMSAPPAQDLAAVAPQPAVGGQRGALAEQHIAERHAGRGRAWARRVRTQVAGRLVVEAQQIAVLERVVVDRGRHRGAPLGEVEPAVLGDGGGLVEDLPAALAQAEAELGIFAEGVEAGVEDLAPPTATSSAPRGGTEWRRRWRRKLARPPAYWPRSGSPEPRSRWRQVRVRRMPQASSRRVPSAAVAAQQPAGDRADPLLRRGGVRGRAGGRRSPAPAGRRR